MKPKEASGCGELPKTPTQTLEEDNLVEEQMLILAAVVLKIMGKSIPFLVDSGASMSLIKHSEFGNNPPKMSGRVALTVGASGLAMTEEYTVPSSVSKQNDEYRVKHSFLYSKLAGDLMCRWLLRNVTYSLRNSGSEKAKKVICWQALVCSGVTNTVHCL